MFAPLFARASTSVEPKVFNENLRRIETALRTSMSVQTPAKSSWRTISGIPEEFPPSPHEHLISDISGLTAALAAKLSGTVSSHRIPIGTGTPGVLSDSSLREDGEYTLHADRPYFYVGTNGTGQVHANGLMGSGDLTISVNGTIRLLGDGVFDSSPTAPTPAVGDYSGKLATTAFVKSLGYASSADLSLKADLVDGKIPASQLPGSVDGIIECNTRAGQADFSAGWLEDSETLDVIVPASNKQYLILSSGTYQNRIYRWSGTQYAEVSSSLALGSTSSTAGRGDHTETAYLHSFALGNPHSTAIVDIAGLTTALAAKLSGTVSNTVIPRGTSTPGVLADSGLSDNGTSLFAARQLFLTSLLNITQHTLNEQFTVIGSTTAENADNRGLQLSGGGQGSTTRAAYINLFGNNYSRSPNQGGMVIYAAGNVSSGEHSFLTNDGAESFRVGRTQNTSTLALALSSTTANTVPYIDASKRVVSSAVTPTELGFLSGASSNLPTAVGNRVVVTPSNGENSATAPMYVTCATITSPGANSAGAVALRVGARYCEFEVTLLVSANSSNVLSLVEYDVVKNTTGGNDTLESLGYKLAANVLTLYLKSNVAYDHYTSQLIFSDARLSTSVTLSQSPSVLSIIALTPSVVNVSGRRKFGGENEFASGPLVFSAQNPVQEAGSCALAIAGMVDYITEFRLRRYCLFAGGRWSPNISGTTEQYAPTNPPQFYELSYPAVAAGSWYIGRTVSVRVMANCTAAASGFFEIRLYVEGVYRGLARFTGTVATIHWAEFQLVAFDDPATSALIGVSSLQSSYAQDVVNSAFTANTTTTLDIAVSGVFTAPSGTANVRIASITID